MQKMYTSSVTKTDQRFLKQPNNTCEGTVQS